MLFARWALSVSALGVIGAFGATLLRYPADARVITVARRASIAFGLSTLLIVAAQLYAWFGVDGFTDPANLGTMLSITLWGLHWTWLAIAAISVIVQLSLSARWPRTWIYASGAAALTVAAFVPLIGHGATHGAFITMLHRAHLFGGGLWMGSLTVALVAGRKDIDQLLTSLRRFAPIAMTGALLLSATGVTLAWQHLKPVSLLWTTDYGRVLIAKVTAVLIIGVLGGLNWSRPRLRLVIAEVTIAIVIVLALTAILATIEPPMAGH